MKTVQLTRADADDEDDLEGVKDLEIFDRILL